MRRLVLTLPVVAMAITSASCGSTRTPRTLTPGADTSLASHTPAASRRACPRGVLYEQSTVAPVKQVLLAAQALLARQQYGSQGTTYRLTPRNAPIDELFRTATLGGPEDATQPGLIRLHRAAERQCGERIAQASWAIHYSIPVSVIANAGAWTFIVKTRRGWRFWGNWCGAGKPRRWRTYYCY